MSPEADARPYTRWGTVVQRSGRLRLGLAFLTGLLFLLPHLVRMETLGSYAAYSPFTGAAGSAMTWDETFLYGAEANFTLTRGGALAYDDTWEHRAAVYPYSVLPTAMEAGLARVTGGLKNAHLIIAFVFPALTAWVLMSMVGRLGASPWLGGLVALTVLVLGFSLRTLFLNDRSFLLHGSGGPVLDVLQGVRTPNPGMTLLQYLGALYCAAAAIRWRQERSRSLRWAVTAGAVGGLLFFSYTYYAIAWSATILMLSVLSLWRGSGVPRSMIAGLAVSIGMTAPFLWWKHLAAVQGSYLDRSERLGMTAGHQLYRSGVLLSAEWAALTLVLLLLWASVRRRRGGEAERSARAAWERALVWVVALTMAGGIAALNMQVVTGFTVQAEFHLPHMVLQPFAMLLAGLVLAVVWERERWPALPAALGFCVLFAASAVAQFEGARNSAELHRVSQPDAALFAWLAEHSAVGSVVATDDLPLSVELPVMTHNSVLFAQGSRGTAPNAELLERFLLASRLVSAPADRVRAELAQDVPGERYAIPKTYTYYLFEISPIEDRAHPRIAEPFLPGVMRQYATMDPGAELKKLRVDYLWTRPDETPAAVSGWTWHPEVSTGDGVLWSLRPAV